MNDSVGQKVFAFDYDLESGDIFNKKVLVDFAGTEGEPDGMVVEFVPSILLTNPKAFNDFVTAWKVTYGLRYMVPVESVSC